MFRNVRRSLGDYMSDEYVQATARAAEVMTGLSRDEALGLLYRKADFYPEEVQTRYDALLSRLGERLLPPVTESVKGFGTESFEKASKYTSAPLSAGGFLRLAEDGRLFFNAKSEAYHLSLGHSFPGHALLDIARRLGITNATHNNTRGHITRRLERELIRVANGIPAGDEAALDALIGRDEPHLLNRVLNLNTGSLAVEAAVKMLLARFYRAETTSPQPRHSGKKPVLLVMGDLAGGTQGNYHGTTVTTQLLRGQWPQMADTLRDAGCLEVVPVAINDAADFKEKLIRYNRGDTRVAGFCHELILMNYSAIALSPGYLRECYALCHEQGVPVLVDEVQSGAWYPELLLFLRYGLKPDIVTIGKGFPAAYFSSSRVITTASLDSLSQYGALITNGQEELGSLSYLITMDFVTENAEEIRAVGDYIEARFRAFAAGYPELVKSFEGVAHLGGISFHDTEKVIVFCKRLNARCVDISAQTYKADCPPTALLKFPVVTTRKAVDLLLGLCEEAIREIQHGPGLLL